jgi:hypothetical protein
MPARISLYAFDRDMRLAPAIYGMPDRLPLSRWRASANFFGPKNPGHPPIRPASCMAEYRAIMRKGTIMPSIDNSAAPINAPRIESAGSLINIGSSQPASGQAPAMSVVQAINAAHFASLGTPINPIRWSRSASKSLGADHRMKANPKMSNTYAYPDDDEYARIYIEAHDAALPATTPESPGLPRHWRLAAHAAATVAVIKAMTAASAPAADTGAVV